MIKKRSHKKKFFFMCDLFFKGTQESTSASIDRGEGIIMDLFMKTYGIMTTEKGKDFVCDKARKAQFTG